MAHQYHFTTYPIHAPSGDLTGVVRLGELLKAVSMGKGGLALRDVALPISAVPVARPDEALDKLLERVGRALDHRVLVFDEGRLAGILSPADVARMITVRRAVVSSSPAAA